MRAAGWRLLGLLLVGGCQQQAALPAAAARPPATQQLTGVLSPNAWAHAQIKTAVAGAAGFAPRLQLAATLVADPQKFASVGARVAGRVAAIRVMPGQRVDKNQALVEVEAVELHQVTTEYLVAASRDREARDVLARLRRLVDERVGALQDLRHAETNAETARAAFAEADEHLHFLGLDDAAIAAMRLGSSHGTQTSIVRAPMAGHVADVHVALGQVLTGTETLVDIVDADPIWAILKLYERDLTGVHCGLHADLNVFGYAAETFAATVAAVGDRIDPLTHTVDLRLALPNPSHHLKPGMGGTATLQLPADPNAAWLPVEAVQALGAQRVYFRRTGPREFLAVPIAAGAERSGLLPVTPAPAPEAEVVVQGAFALRAVLERGELQDD